MTSENASKHERFFLKNGVQLPMEIILKRISYMYINWINKSLFKIVLLFNNHTW